jgi:redox-sensitive bicupin YhaK (pirin superfamily)
MAQAEEAPAGGAARPVQAAWSGRPTVEGAGVHLTRMFGFQAEPVLDPFLLLDHFGSDRPADYLAGFPWHPHRGIETITYVLAGEVEHGDSLGNKGVIGPGDVQWMTAGSGIIHQEMPRGDAGGRNAGFQLWANLPAAQKMRDPHYRGLVAAEIPEVTTPEGARVKVICGAVGGVTGPVEGVVIDPEYLDVTLPPGATFTHPVPRGHTAFACAFEGEGRFGRGPTDNLEGRYGAGTLVHFGDGDRVRVAAGPQGVRFILAAGRPIREPVAWHGPIVMNTREEIRTAIRELNEGTFIKYR